MSSGPPLSRRGFWPEAAQFNEAVQNLATTMADRELQAGQAELGPLGMPMPYAGNFADVYKVHCPATGNTWAVKFFKREVRDLRERYRAINDALVVAQLPFMVQFRYLDEGVRIAGRWYPILKMRWIEGHSLNRFVAQSLDQPRMLDQLVTLWVKLAQRLREARIAHADLQHGNVVLVPGDDGRLLLKLIDYDGMYVPELAGRASGEVGHPNYQHPQRARDGGNSGEVDRFSHLVICCALRGERVGRRALWERFDNGDNLLFTASDFAAPAESALFRELWTFRNAGARALAGHLALATQVPLDQVPLVEELIQNGQVRPLTLDERRAVEALLHRDSPRSLPPAPPVPPPLMITPAETMPPAGNAPWVIAPPLPPPPPITRPAVGVEEAEIIAWTAPPRGATYPPLRSVVPGSPFGAFSRRQARSRLLGPAIGLLATSSLWLVYIATILVMDPPPPAAMVGIAGMFMLPAICSLAGAVQMLQVKTYLLCMAGVISGMLPCTCCWLSLPFAIWGLVVLCDQGVQLAFKEKIGE